MPYAYIDYLLEAQLPYVGEGCSVEMPLLHAQLYTET